MGFVLGFGSTESDFEATEEEAIRQHIEERFIADDLCYFTDEFAEGVRQWVNERAAILRANDREYKTATEYPPRYGYYSATVLSDASHIAVILSFLHTNRRHGLSPDGWACLQTKRLFDVESYKIERRAAA